MANDIVAGLFGLSPDQVRQQQQLEIQKAAYSQAQMNPFDRAGMMMAQGGAGLVDVAAPAFGLQNREVAAAQTRQEVLQGLDVTDPESIKAAGESARQRGDFQLATQLSQLANQREVEKAAIARSAAQTAKDQAEADAKNREQNKPNIEKVGLSTELQPVYFDKNTKSQFILDATGKPQLYTGAIHEKPGVTVNVGDKGQGAFAIEMGKEDAKRVTAAQTAGTAAADQLQTLGAMAKSSDAALSGSLAAGRASLLNLYNTLGLSTPQENDQLTKSTMFTKQSGDLIVTKIKALGTNPSNSDLIFIRQIVPQLENSADARRQLIRYLADKAQAVVDETARIDVYARAHGGLGGYKPVLKLSGSDVSAALRPQLSPEQARAELQRRQGAQ
jgi:hypothetical protein